MLFLARTLKDWLYWIFCINTFSPFLRSFFTRLSI